MFWFDYTTFDYAIVTFNGDLWLSWEVKSQFKIILFSIFFALSLVV